MIAHQEDGGAFVGEPDQAVDDAARVGAAVHVVAEEDQAVVRAQRKGPQQVLELVEAAVDVADRVEHRGAWA